MRIREGLEPNYELYKKMNLDEVGVKVISFGERIAEGIEQRIDAGLPLEEVASSVIAEANIDNIKGTQYGCAIAGLWKFWEQGEAIRLWHNSQFGKEVDGVVNPEMVDLPPGVQCYKHPDRLAVAEISYKIKGVSYKKKICGYCGDAWHTKWGKNGKVRRTLRIRQITEKDLKEGV